MKEKNIKLLCALLTWITWKEIFHENGHDSDVISEQNRACEGRKGVKIIKPNR